MRTRCIYMLAIIGWIASTAAQAQSQILDFGQITLSELKQSQFPADTSAEAAILFDIGSTRFDLENRFSIIHKRRYRIKIYKKTAFAWGNVEFPLYVANAQNPERLENIRAMSYTYEDGNIVTKEMTRKEIFRERRDKDTDVIRFTVPNVRQGSVVDIEYEFISPYYAYLPPWQFQRSIPVLWSKIVINMPPFFDYKILKTGNFQVVKTTVERSKERQARSYKFTESVFTLSAQDIPAFKDEPFISNIIDHILYFRFQLAKVALPDLATEEYMTTWEGFSDKVMRDFSLGDHLDDKAGKDIALNLVQNIPPTDLLARAKAIYQYVQNNFQYDGVEQLNINNPPKKLLTTRKGNCADIHVLLCNMLNFVGVEAKPVLISTRDHGAVLREYPFISQFNYVLAMAKVGQDRYLLDATNRHLIFGMLPPDCVNGMGVVIEKIKRKQEAQFVPLEQAINYQHRTAVQIKRQANSNRLELSANMLLGGYAALWARNQQLDEAKFKKTLVNTAIEEFSLQNMEDKSKNITLKFKVANPINTDEDILYLDLPYVLPELKENPLNKETRDFPLDFNYKRDYTYIFNLEIPEGYQLEDKPAPVSLALPNNLAKLDIGQVITEKLVQISVRFTVNSAVIPPQYYAQLREMFVQMSSGLSAPIVLKKKK